MVTVSFTLYLDVLGKWENYWLPDFFILLPLFFCYLISPGSSNQPLLALNIIDSSIKQSFFIYLGITIFGARAVPLRRVTLCNPCNIHRSLYYNNCHINMYELNFEDHTATFKLSSFCPQYIKNAWAQRPSCCMRRNSTRSRGPHPSLSSLVTTVCIKVIMCIFLLPLDQYRYETYHRHLLAFFI